jgi:DNA-directed RNA polymerase specialized sigma24 family protein
MEVTWGVAIGETRTPMAEDQERRAAEQELVRAAQGGDLLAFERLYRDNERKVFGLCFRMSSDPALAEELTQEVFVLHDVEGRTHEEIAALLNLAPGTSKAQLFRARRLLREALAS